MTQATTPQWNELVAAIKASDDWRAEQMPDEAAALRVFFQAYQRLKEFGWREIANAPNDCDVQLIEPGSTGIHEGRRGLTGNDQQFWIYAANDLWPSNPVLWRRPAPPQREEAGR